MLENPLPSALSKVANHRNGGNIQPLAFDVCTREEYVRKQAEDRVARSTVRENATSPDAVPVMTTDDIHQTDLTDADVARAKNIERLRKSEKEANAKREAERQAALEKRRKNKQRADAARRARVQREIEEAEAETEADA